MMSCVFLCGKSCAQTIGRTVLAPIWNVSIAEVVLLIPCNGSLTSLIAFVIALVLGLLNMGALGMLFGVGAAITISAGQ